MRINNYCDDDVQLPTLNCIFRKKLQLKISFCADPYRHLIVFILGSVSFMNRGLKRGSFHPGCIQFDMIRAPHQTGVF